MCRFTWIESGQCKFIADDECCHIGEYTSGGGHGASETNQQIFNLKKRPDASPTELMYKRRAVQYWGNKLLKAMDWETVLDDCTFVPMPCSKTKEHPHYDSRMEDVLMHVKNAHPNVDVRPLLYQKQDRDPQHTTGRRAEPDEIYKLLGLDERYLTLVPKRNIILLDDVITRGASFAAAKRLLQERIEYSRVFGIFLAKTVHPPIELDLPGLDELLGW